MILDIRTISQGHSVVEQNADFTDYSEQGPPFFDSVLCRAQIDRRSLEIYVNMYYTAVVRMSCARCLEDFSDTIEGDFYIMMYPESQQEKFGNDEDGESSVFYFDPDNEADLRPLVYDEIATAVPMKPLCTPECKGVPTGRRISEDIMYSTDEGQDGNTEDAIDPRWEALRKLKNRK